MKINIAHVSQHSREQSSSFIQVHLNGLKGNVVHFHGGYLPHLRENENLVSLDIKEKIILRFKKKINGFTAAEWQLIKQFRKDQIGLIFGEYGPTGAALYKIAQFLAIPMIVHFHGFDAHHLPTLDKYRKKYDGFLLNQPNIIVVSKEMSSVIQTWGVEESNILYSPCGCQPKFVEAEITDDRNGFLTVGNFISKKGPAYTIKAYAAAVHAGVTTPMSMIGDGPLLEECKALVKELNVEKQVQFLGRLLPDETFEIMKKSKIFLQHSLTLEDGNKEGTPVAILEAQALGLPVISTKHAGIKDVVIQNETGILVEEGDIDSMSAAIIELANDDDKRKTMGLAAREWVKDHWTSQHHMDKINEWIYLRFYQS
jgi:colanic acid/amylovoran biosynthesis glycosyltransferase